METSKTIHSFKVSVQKRQTLLTAQEYPWSVLQVIPTSAEDFDKTVEKLKERGMVACHDTDRTFCIIHLGSGDIDGTHPERHVNVNQKNYKRLIDELRDTMAQAAVWFDSIIQSK